MSHDACTHAHYGQKRQKFASGFMEDGVGVSRGVVSILRIFGGLGVVAQA